MSSEVTIQLIRDALQLLYDVNRNGGAENAPCIWQEYTAVRTKLLKELELPDTRYYRKILEVPFNKPVRQVSFASIRDTMASAGITTTDNFTNLDVYLEEHVAHVHGNLMFEAETVNVVHGFWFSYLFYARLNRVPITDVLLVMNVEDMPYTRFLIGTILYGNYGTTSMVMRELHRTKRPDVEFAFLYYNTGLVSNRAEAIVWLKKSGLQFIDRFLWMEQDVPSLIQSP
jgi:hypothetical protein